jgi:hypothetical protein
MNNIKVQHDYLIAQLKDYASRLKDLRDSCPHTDAIETTEGANYEYIVYHCPDCGIRWSEDT